MKLVNVLRHKLGRVVLGKQDEKVHPRFAHSAINEIANELGVFVDESKIHEIEILGRKTSSFSWMPSAVGSSLAADYHEKLETAIADIANQANMESSSLYLLVAHKSNAIAFRKKLAFLNHYISPLVFVGLFGITDSNHNFFLFVLRLAFLVLSINGIRKWFKK